MVFPATFQGRAGRAKKGFEIYSKDDNFDGEALWQYLLTEGAPPSNYWRPDVTSMPYSTTREPAS